MVDKDSLYVNLFISNKSVVELQNKTMNVEVVSRFPNDGDIKVNISSNNNEKASIAIRIPDYAENFNIMINDKTYLFEISEGYAVINGSFNDDIIEVKFDSPAKFIYSNPLVRADFGKVAITKGPAVYCLEEVDNGSNLAGVIIDTNKKIEEIYDETLLGGATILYIDGQKVDEESWNSEKLYSTERPNLKEVKLKAVPYC